MCVCVCVYIARGRRAGRLPWPLPAYYLLLPSRTQD